MLPEIFKIGLVLIVIGFVIYLYAINHDDDNDDIYPLT